MTVKLEKNETTGLEIAVIGMAGRFPGAKNIDEYWENLKNGMESISFFSYPELEEAGIDPELLSNPNYVSAASCIEGGEYFDPAFFNYTPLEARAMDPQLRIYHECIWTALEEAGCNPESYPGPIGVYAGASAHPAWIIEALSHIKNPSQRFDVFNLNNNPSFGTRISYNLNLKGPSFALQTACSTSLVAVHLACQGLLNAECDIALAGGVALDPLSKAGYIFQEGMINSPDGHCRAFDSRARGTIKGEGVGVVVLKRLEEAIEEDDFIYAVIKGTAINNDGSRKIGYSAPSVDGQAEVIKAALKAAELEPGCISYLETHGTGTPLGDPVEIEGLKLVFNTRNGGDCCAVGSVKSNMGHLDNAAGIASFIKTVLALKHRLIPPSLHFETPNPGIDFENSPLYVNNTLKEWQGEYPIRAGVSSFGIGGTNAHVILEEWPDSHSSNAEHKAQSEDPVGIPSHSSTPQLSNSSTHQLFLLSARTPPALETRIQNLVDHFKKNPALNLENVAYTLQVGRKTFKYRTFATGSTIERAIENLSSAETGKLSIYATMAENRPVIFMFPGQGSQYVDMGLDLYKTEQVFRDEMNCCFKIVELLLGCDLKDILYPGFSHPLKPESRVEARRAVPKEPDLLAQTEITQPVMFIFEYALAKLLLDRGISPCAMIGHSIGEYTAACLSGVFSLEDALGLVVLRGKLMGKVPRGDMLSAAMSEKELIPFLNETLSLAAVNGPGNCVVSGTKEAVAALARKLKEKGTETRLLFTSHAFHSPMMDPIMEQFAEEVKQISLNKPQKPFISNVSGKWISGEEAVDPGYWAAHLRRTVRFSDGLTRLFKDWENAVLVEVGPGRVLSTLTRQHPDKKPEHSTLYLVRHPKEEAADDHFLLEKIGQLWQRGVKIDWAAVHGGKKMRRVPLPTYPFERHSFGLKRDFRVERDDTPVKALEKTGKIADITRWFYAPSWKGIRIPTHRRLRMPGQNCWLVLSDECGLGSSLVERLHKEQQRVVTVSRGTAFKKESETLYTINPRQEEDYDILFKSLKSQNLLPERIIHLWNVSREVDGSPLSQVDQLLESGFFSLLYLPRAMSRQKIKQPVSIEVVSSQLQAVVGHEDLCAAKAVLLGPVKVIPLEYPNVHCRSIDLELPRDNYHQVVDDLLLEFFTQTGEPLVALRGCSRWVRDFEPLRIAKTGEENSCLKRRGVYLLTGGLGGMGLVFAAELAKKWQARLILIDKSEFPPAEEWDHRLEQDKQNQSDPVCLKIRRLRQLQKAGAEILVSCADVSDLTGMRAVIRQAVERFGPINGVIHTAGLPDGGLIQVRTRQQSEVVLAPKVKGTLVLDTLLESQQLDFFVVCSSINSVLAPPGQAAYCAANSFLDTYALQKTSSDTFTLSINWDTWQEVGMAVAAVETLAGAQPVVHPLLDVCIKEKPERWLYISRISTDRFWVLDEHRILGKATLPGTAYLEIAGAAYTDTTGSNRFEVKELFLLTPLILEDDVQKTLHIVLEKDGNQFKFSIKSRSAGRGDSWQEHARGSIAALDKSGKAHVPLNLQEIVARCTKAEIDIKGKETASPQQYLKVGPRWDNLIMYKSGTKQGLAEIELPGDFIFDLDNYSLHPALMDTATAFLVGNHGGNEPYLPFLFRRVRVLGPIPRKIFSYSRINKEPDRQGSFKKKLAFQITITDEQGSPLVEIGEFILVSVSTHSGEQQAVFTEKSTDPLQDGIQPAEGVEVFNRLLPEAPPQVLVSTTDFRERLRLHQEMMNSIKLEAVGRERTEEPAHPRPELSSVYEAPVNKVQEKLAAIWQQFLGIGDIGISDDFFELGGDSLKGLTVISEIHKVFQVELSITDLFATPTIRGLAETIDSGRESIYASILPVEERQYYPLSSAQKRLYFLQQLQPASVVYNIPNILAVAGKVDKDRLLDFENALRVLIRRQESLRTSFHLIAGQPVQRISDFKNIEFAIEYHSAAGEDPAPKNPGSGAEARRALPGELEASIIERFVRPFDLTQPPLMRVEVVKIDRDRHLWLFDIHHIVSDASGLAILNKELFRIVDGEELTPLKVQYRDFCHWQDELFSSGKIKEQRGYWMQVFSDGVPELDLPTDFPRAEVSSFSGEMHLFSLSKEKTLKFLEAGSAAGATLFMNLVTVLNVLLYKYSGQGDIVIGSSIAGRPHVDLRDIVGMFVNMLAIRNFPQQDISYLRFLQQVKTTVLEAFENQDMQFEMLVEELGLKGDTSRNPLFDVCINVQNYEQPVFEIEGLTFSHGGFQYKNAKFDMLLWANQAGDEIHFMLEYSTDLFKLETAQEFSKHLVEIIDQVSRNKEIELKDIKLSYQVVSPTVKAPEIDFDF